MRRRQVILFGELPAAIPERDRAVAAVYGAVLPEPRLKLITSWGLSDRTTWLHSFFPRFGWSAATAVGLR